jgi:acyl-CoA synthetase (AMP-forming)/AMP-acid ligase II
VVQIIQELVTRSDKGFVFLENSQDRTKDFKNEYQNSLTFFQNSKANTIFLLLDGSYLSASVLLAAKSTKANVFIYSKDISQLEILSDIEKFHPNVIVMPQSKTMNLHILNYSNEMTVGHLQILLLGTSQTSYGVCLLPLSDVLISRTSGSTGQPKYLVLEEDILHFRFLNFIDTYDLVNTRSLFVSSSFHQTITIRALLASLSLNCTFISLFPFNPYSWINQYRSQECFALLVPPQARRILNSLPNMSSSRIGSILLSSSASLGEEKKRIIENLASSLFECYGTAEIAIATSIRHELGNEKSIVSVGKPVADVEIEVSDEQGRLRVKSKQAIKSVIHVGDRSVEVRSISEWYDTGDCGFIDGGQLFLLGRQSDRIDVGGSKVFAREIEEIMARHDQIIECLAFPVPDDLLGQTVGLAIVRRSDELTNAEVIKYASANMEPFKIPRLITFVNSIPLTVGGKPDRERLTKESERGE